MEEIIVLFVVAAAYLILSAYMEVWKTVRFVEKTKKEKYLFRHYKLMASRWK